MRSKQLTSHWGRTYNIYALFIECVKNEWLLIFGGVLCIQE